MIKEASVRTILKLPPCALSAISSDLKNIRIRVASPPLRPPFPKPYYRKWFFCLYPLYYNTHPSYFVKGFNQILMFVNNYFTIRAGDKRSLRRIGGLKCQYLSLVRVPVKRDKRSRVHFSDRPRKYAQVRDPYSRRSSAGMEKARLRSYIIKIYQLYKSKSVEI